MWSFDRFPGTSICNITGKQLDYIIYPVRSTYLVRYNEDTDNEVRLLRRHRLTQEEFKTDPNNPEVGEEITLTEEDIALWSKALTHYFNN